MTPTAMKIVFIAALVVLSAVMAGAETAFVRMNRIRALSLAEEGNKNAARLARMLEHPERTLNVVLLLLLGCQMTVATLVGKIVDPHGTAGLVFGILIEVVVFFTLAEVIPKTYAVQHTDVAAVRLAPLLSALTRFPPFRAIAQLLIGLANVLIPGPGLREGPFVSEAEIRQMADVAAAEDVIEREERRLIHAIFEFGDTVVREVMVPRTDMLMIEANATIDEALSMLLSRGYSRLPVYKEQPDDIIGIAYLKDLVRKTQEGKGKNQVRRLAREAKFVPEQVRVADLLRDMQREKFHMAIVVDEYGGVAGLVTLEDLLEEIVGEITDEYDADMPGVEHLDDGTLRVAGSMAIDDVNELLGLDLPDDEWDTVGGLMFNLLGHLPEPGETVTCQGVTLKAEKVQRRRIVTVHIQPPPPSPNGAQATDAGE